MSSLLCKWAVGDLCAASAPRWNRYPGRVCSVSRLESTGEFLVEVCRLYVTDDGTEGESITTWNETYILVAHSKEVAQVVKDEDAYYTLRLQVYHAKLAELTTEYDDAIAYEQRKRYKEQQRQQQLQREQQKRARNSNI